MKRRDLWIRDPFVFVDKQTETYYLYGSTEGRNQPERSFAVYKSKDLENFDDGKVIFDGKANGFWADKDFWAPEVHFYKGKYYMLASFKKDGVNRATQILVCDRLDGQFKPLTESPVTPKEWMCLDGTLWIENGVPYLVFSHEWVQIYDGEICAVRLTDDLKNTVGKPFTLFKASDNKDVSDIGEREGNKCYVTDGPFLFSENGKIKMIWSSFVGGKYAVLTAEAQSITGKWTHTGVLLKDDGGHAMVFTDVNGNKKISLHSPNVSGKERPVFIDCKSAVMY